MERRAGDSGEESRAMAGGRGRFPRLTTVADGAAGSIPDYLRLGTPAINQTTASSASTRANIGARAASRSRVALALRVLRLRSASSAGRSQPFPMSTRTRTYTLPSEILYEVVGQIFVRYLDAVVAGPAHQLRQIEALNPVKNLLMVSYQFREVTLKVISDCLGIERDESGK